MSDEGYIRIHLHLIWLGLLIWCKQPTVCSAKLNLSNFFLLFGFQINSALWINFRPALTHYTSEQLVIPIHEAAGSERLLVVNISAKYVHMFGKPRENMLYEYLIYLNTQYGKFLQQIHTHFIKKKLHTKNFSLYIVSWFPTL